MGMSLGFPGLFWRTAVRARGFLVGSILTVGLAIAVLVAGFQLGEAAVLAPQRKAQTLGLARVVTEEADGEMSFPDFADFAERGGGEAQWVAVSRGHQFGVEIAGEVGMHPGAVVSHSYFTAMGTRFVAGRDWPQRVGERLAQGLGVIVSEQFCRARLAPGVDPVGLPIRIATAPFVIVGVVPDAPVLGDTVVPEVWVPLADSGVIGNPWLLTEASRGQAWLQVWTRADAGDAAVQGKIAKVGAEIARENPETRSRSRYQVLGARAAFWQTERQAAGMYVTAAAVAWAIFLIAACNVCTLGLLQMLRRGPELGVRMALGATTRHLWRDEAGLVIWLVAGAGVVGVVGAMTILGLVVRYGPADLAAVVPAGVSVSMIALATGLAMLAGGAVFGVQAVVINRGQTHPLVRDQRSLAGRNANRWFLAVQAALALALAIPAGLLLRSATTVLAADLGYDRNGLLIVEIDVRDRGYEKVDGLAYWQRVLDAAAVNPLIMSAGISNRPPFSPVGSATPSINGVRVSRSVGFNVVGPGFFSTLGQRIIQGRDITLADDQLDARVVVVNEAMANAFWPGESPVGRSVLVFPGRPESRVIGVTQDLRISAYGRHEPMIYVPIGIGWTSRCFLYLRHRGSTIEAMRAAEAVLAQADPQLPAREMVSFNDTFARQTAALRWARRRWHCWRRWRWLWRRWGLTRSRPLPRSSVATRSRSGWRWGPSAGASFACWYWSTRARGWSGWWWGASWAGWYAVSARRS